MPKISVVMPVYNGEKYLREAIDSILNQTLSDFEFIIINDASTDKTEEIIKSYTDNRIKYLKNEKNLGVAGTLNKGLDVAKGEYIARMDADDISLPLRFEKQVKFMDKHRNIAVCGGVMEHFGADDNKKAYTVLGIDNMRINFLFDSCLFHPTVMMRKSVIENEHYRYDTQFDKVEDFELWTRLVLKYGIDNINQTLLKYRIHQNQVTQNYNNEHKEKASKVRYNYLKALGVKADNEEIKSYMDFCNKDFDYSTQIKSLISIFNKIVKANKKTGFMCEKKLKKYLFLITYNLYKKHGIISANDLINISNYITKKDFIKIETRTFIKNLIKGKGN